MMSDTKVHRDDDDETLSRRAFNSIVQSNVWFDSIFPFFFPFSLSFACIHTKPPFDGIMRCICFCTIHLVSTQIQSKWWVNLFSFGSELLSVQFGAMVWPLQANQIYTDLKSVYYFFMYSIKNKVIIRYSAQHTHTTDTLTNRCVMDRWFGVRFLYSVTNRWNDHGNNMSNIWGVRRHWTSEPKWRRKRTNVQMSNVNTKATKQSA